MINFLENQQLIEFNHIKKTCAYCFADQISAPLIKVTRFKNLQVTNIIALSSYLICKSASTKSSIIIKKSTGGDFISYRDL